jgi:glutaconate CoA-transferase subunit B
MQVLSLNPGVTLDQVRAATAFDLGVQSPLETTAPPTARELQILREDVDPHGFVIGR